MVKITRDKGNAIVEVHLDAMDVYSDKELCEQAIKLLLEKEIGILNDIHKSL